MNVIAHNNPTSHTIASLPIGTVFEYVYANRIHTCMKMHDDIVVSFNDPNGVWTTLHETNVRAHRVLTPGEQFTVIVGHP